MISHRAFPSMQIARRQLLAGGSAAFLAGCTTMAAPPLSAPETRRSIVPLNADRAHVMKVTVCLRPFRPAGPRLEAETFGDKTVIHNYGHGGSGWSLSWGCAQEAAMLARSGGANRFAVIGAGVIGLTTAIKLIETGADVTIYAHEFPAETRSARATGVWSPSSRIGLANAVDAGFAGRWENWARASYPVHQQMIGLAGDPAEFLPQYNVAGGTSARPAETREFLRLSRRLRGLTPPWGNLDGIGSPFPNRTVRSGQTMVFNVAEYSDRLTRMFLLRGGKMIRRTFPDQAAILALPESVIVNCMGFAAKTIWNDPQMVPVRGQIGWLVPQPGARYALYYDSVQAVSRHDGVVVQYLGPNDDWGYGDASETIDPDETARALTILRQLF